MSALGGKRTLRMVATKVFDAVRFTRRAVKLLASLATISACLIALVVGLGASDGSWQSHAYLGLVLAIPVLQLFLLGAGTVREMEHPRQAITLYAGAVLCLTPVGVFIALN